MKTKIGSFVDKDVTRTRDRASSAEQHQNIGGGRNVGRRFFMKSLAMGGALLVPVGASFAEHDDKRRERMSISDGDAAILRFLAAAEILETDLWQQYTEFANLDGPFADALETIDDDMPLTSRKTRRTNSAIRISLTLYSDWHSRPIELCGNATAIEEQCRSGGKSTESLSAR